MANDPAHPPSRTQVEQAFVDVLAGRRTRDEIDQWAGQWVYADDPPDMEDAVWEALGNLAGCDLTLPNGEYLHSNEQIQQWLEEFQRATIR